MKNDSGEEVVEATTDESVKPSEYVKELLKEKVTLNPEEHSNAMRLIDQGSYASVSNVQTPKCSVDVN